ncbi:hypothetical protein HK096_001352, partial [Nowakowskiella sp. JEL0078]
MSLKDFKTVSNYYEQNVKGEKLPSGDALLKNYSPWLAEYQSRNEEMLIEIPGQYGGSSRPNPMNHAYIASFHPQILIMSSIRRPKRLTVIGTDEKEYMFLVKGGEDLRLDQRVQQIFQIMNKIMEKNSYCSGRRISLHTYKVVPMSTNLGIIEWVSNTKPLRACMSDSPHFEKQNSNANSIFNKFLGTFVKNNVFKGYEVMMSKNHPRETFIGVMEAMWKATSESYLRDFFIKLCACPEAFLSVRQQFAESLATLNICSYILEVLPIPELVPFRLTRQIELFLEPLGIAVLLQVPMMNVLSAMQENKGILLNALDIFAKEPLMEWRTFAIKQAKKMKARGGLESQSMEIDESSITAPAWYPTQKLEIAKRKLDGDNPAIITAEELRIGHEDQPFYQSMKTAVLGNKSVNIRAKVDAR